jgi:putative endonuclease
MINTRKTGADGEQKAVDFLITNGYTIIERNIHFGKIGEIDIIAKDTDGTVVFVEVKYNQTRSSAFGTPEERCDARKIRQLIKLSRLYIHNKNLYNKAVRIDVIAIDPDGIRHYTNCSMM